MLLAMLIKGALGISAIGYASALYTMRRARMYIVPLLIMGVAASADMVAIIFGFRAGIPLLDEIGLLLGAVIMSHAAVKERKGLTAKQ